MANSREIQARMKSIKDTMKITNAMCMISSSKLQKARRDLKNTEPYFYAIQETLGKILELSPETGNEFFNSRYNIPKKERKQGYIVVTADKGMAGAYNHNVIKIAEKEALSDNKNMLFVVGQVGRRYFEKKNIPVDIDFKYTAQNPNMNRARIISEKIVDLFKRGELDEVYIVYTRMINSVTFNAEIKQLLPLSLPKLSDKKDNNYQLSAFEPDIDTVFEHIVPNYIAGFVYGALVESYCSEHNARMMAMQTATDAAKDMLKQLDIEYNRARQAAITQEITEVIAGSKAQKKKMN
ncbi:MAG: ATP synthase F1 subunit gamma [Acetobacter sp.]|nr:ATP synthase F1 subunit gamma [Bacteroides sp.]MCM1341782.1 ATP synthase F1 subunit gamma [Acetobacter sp.]MCM1433125.1 ATP synthase F1 subunit gamma [Clostridiales bacterium]